MEGRIVGRLSPVPQEEWIRFGIPPEMYPMEMLDEKPQDRRVAGLFRDIRRSIRLSRIPHEFRTLALWPAYLEGSWKLLRPMLRTRVFRELEGGIRMEAMERALRLPIPIRLERDEAFLRTTRELESTLPSLILAVELLRLDIAAVREIEHPPFPAELRSAA